MSHSLIQSSVAMHDHFYDVHPAPNITMRLSVTVLLAEHRYRPDDPNHPSVSMRTVSQQIDGVALPFVEFSEGRTHKLCASATNGLFWVPKMFGNPSALLTSEKEA
jgi:hypothetical protein